MQSAKVIHSQVLTFIELYRKAVKSFGKAQREAYCELDRAWQAYYGCDFLIALEKRISKDWSLFDQNIDVVNVPLLDSFLRFFGDGSLRDISPLGIALGTFSPNGYHREAALRELLGRKSPLALPFVLLRLRDWVPEIRSIAGAAVREYLVPGRVTELASSLNLLNIVLASPRAQAKGLRAEIEVCLIDSAAHPEMLNQLQSGEPQTRGYAFMLLLRLDLCAIYASMWLWQLLNGFPLTALTRIKKSSCDYLCTGELVCGELRAGYVPK